MFFVLSTYYSVLKQSSKLLSSGLIVAIKQICETVFKQFYKALVNFESLKFKFLDDYAICNKHFNIIFTFKKWLKYKNKLCLIELNYY